MTNTILIAIIVCCIAKFIANSLREYKLGTIVSYRTTISDGRLFFYFTIKVDNEKPIEVDVSEEVYYKYHVGDYFPILK